MKSLINSMKCIKHRPELCFSMMCSHHTLQTCLLLGLSEEELSEGRDHVCLNF